MSTESESRTLNDLRVVDLKSELEKRELDRSGNKQALVERLQNALEEEGLDPKTYQFESDKKPSKRLSTSSSQPESDLKAVEHDDNEELGENSEQTKSTEGKTESTPSEKMEATESASKKEVREDKLAGEKNSSLEEDKTDADGNAEAEGVIRLTLEEEEEALQDEEVEPESISHGDVNNSESQDKKSTSNKNPQEDPGKEVQDKEKTQENKKPEGNNTSVGSSANKTPSRAKKSNIQNRNLWITNISQSTRATELKQALSSYGKVIGAKVVINAKYPGACCYGYVTMDTVEDADNCIAKMNNTELNGQIIRIEKVRPDHINSSKLNQKAPPKIDGKAKPKPLSVNKPPSATQDGEKKDVQKEEKKDDKKEIKNEAHKPDSSTGRRRDSKRKSRSHDRKSRTENENRSRSNSKRARRPQETRDILTFDKIKEERERQRLRERERIIREDTRRRHEEAARQREVERMQRSEAARLDREREKLRMEREKLEREKAEIIKLERERQKLEREKLELERLELQRVKLRLQEEDRRAVKRTVPYRREGSYEDRKRIATDRHYEESPPSPRFDSTGVKPREPTPPSKKFNPMVKDYKARMPYDKREAYPPKRDREYESPRSHPQSSLSRSGPSTTITKYEGSSVFNINRDRDLHDARARDNTSTVPNSRINKDSRYNERERDRSPHYRAIRDDRDRRPIPEHKEPQRFDRNAGGNNWNHPNANNKGFNSGNSGPPKSWGKDSWRPVDTSNNSERWNSGNISRTSMSGVPFSTNSNMNIGPSCPPPPAINSYSGDRFDYKSMGNIRKY